MSIETKQLDCPRCKGYVVVPVLSADERVWAGEELRKLDGSIDRIKHLRSWLEFDLPDSKRFIHHFSATKGQCERCDGDLPEHSLELDHIICPHCQSLNLDW